VVPKEAAHPFPVTAGGAASNMVAFAPVEQVCPDHSSISPVEIANCNPDRNFVSDVEFLKIIADTSEINLEFSIRIVGFKEPLRAACVITVGKALLQYLAENHWFAAMCRSGNVT
jgi:hypothetical protein